MHVKKGDTVLILSGNDKGKTGEVTECKPREQRVVVDGVNLRWRHQRPTQQSPKGERVQREQSIHASNVKRIEASEGGKGAAKKATAKKTAAKKTAAKKTAAKKTAAKKSKAAK
ncbi:MAG TPA: 50S ribosomal protein L24 [Planctomycetota bacterium]|nr:50S ribosomal protein L24 [Planctomycetota bacterium]